MSSLLDTKPEIWKLQRPIDGAGPILAYVEGRRRLQMLDMPALTVEVLFRGRDKIFVRGHLEVVGDALRLRVRHEVDAQDW